jgi:hypothetical protein
MLRSLPIQAELSTAVVVDNPFGFIPLGEIIADLKLRGSSDIFSPMHQDRGIPSMATEDTKEAEQCVLERLRVHTLKTLPGDLPTRGGSRCAAGGCVALCVATERGWGERR